MITDKYPEFQAFVNVLPDGTVIDGEILPIRMAELELLETCKRVLAAKQLLKHCYRKRRLLLEHMTFWNGREKTSGTIRMKKEGNCWKNFMMP